MQPMLLVTLGHCEMRQTKALDTAQTKQMPVFRGGEPPNSHCPDEQQTHVSEIQSIGLTVICRISGPKDIRNPRPSPKCSRGFTG